MTTHDAVPAGAVDGPLIDVDTSSPIPPYEQIRSRLADLITSGVLAAGVKLPPIRQLAGDLDLAPGTVARAYRALDEAGLVTGRVRTGTTVAARPASADHAPADRAPTEHTLQRLNDAARAYAATARALGIGTEEALATVRRHTGG